MAPHGGQALENGERQETCPQEEGKGNAGFVGLAPAISVACWCADEARKGNGTREPEDCREHQQGKGGESVVEASKVDGRDGQVDENEQAPDGAEQQKRIRGRRRDGEAACRVDNCKQAMLAVNPKDNRSSCVMRLTVSCNAQLDNREHGKDRVDDGDESESHVGQDALLFLIISFKTVFSSLRYGVRCCERTLWLSKRPTKAWRWEQDGFLSAGGVQLGV